MPEGIRRRAKPAGILFPIVDRQLESTVLLTPHHHNISFPSQIFCVGGPSGAEGANEVQPVLREAREEIGLPQQPIRILGRMGNYYTHRDYRISPTIGPVSPLFNLILNPDEAVEMIEFPLAHMLRPDFYCLRRRPFSNDRAHFG